MAKRRALATQKARSPSAGRRYPGVQRQRSWITSAIPSTTERFASMSASRTRPYSRSASPATWSIVSADISDWKTGDYEMIRETR